MTVIWRRRNDYCTIDLIVASTERLRHGGDVENRCVKVVLFTVIYSCRARNKKKCIHIPDWLLMRSSVCYNGIYFTHCISTREMNTWYSRSSPPQPIPCSLYIHSIVDLFVIMMTSSIENVSRFTGPLWGEYHRWIPLKMPALVFALVCDGANGWVNNPVAGDYVVTVKISLDASHVAICLALSVACVASLLLSERSPLNQIPLITNFVPVGYNTLGYSAIVSENGIMTIGITVSSFERRGQCLCSILFRLATTTKKPRIAGIRMKIKKKKFVANKKCRLQHGEYFGQVSICVQCTKCKSRLTLYLQT